MLENIFGTSTRRVNVDEMEPIELEEGYDGPHLTFPLTIDQVCVYVRRFVSCGGEPSIDTTPYPTWMEITGDDPPGALQEGEAPPHQGTPAHFCRQRRGSEGGVTD